MKKILLDENLPKQLQQAFSENFQILTISELGWQSKQNGELLKAMKEEEIQYLMTVDKNLQYQQNLAKYGVQIILLLTYNNRLKTLLSQVNAIETALLQSPSDESVFVIDLRTE